MEIVFRAGIRCCSFRSRQLLLLLASQPEFAQAGMWAFWLLVPR